jgi:hypothetical protein
MATAIVLTATSAFAAGPKTVVISGCTTGGVEGCMFLNTPQLRYALYASPPRPAVGRGVTVNGTIEEGPGICLFTPGIRVQRWSYNKLRCPK